MTSELRTLIDFKDVIGLELGCPKCPAKVVQPLHIDQQRNQILKCPSCGANWYVTEHKTNALDILSEFMKAFESIANHESIYATIRLCTKGAPISK